MNVDKLPQIKEYGVKNFRPLLIRERHEIYIKLTKKQRELIDDHRKFLIRSEFLRDSYLKASDWEFQDLRIDSFYPNDHPNQKKLYCECGRRLKYQYIVKSKETGLSIGLGIQHFKDHLNIPQQVASEITERLNNVDLGLDELLWLKRQGAEFPEDLWENYAYYLFVFQQSDQTEGVNYSLAQRFSDFKVAQMPIYISDFQEVMIEINKLKTLTSSGSSEMITTENFEVFKKELPNNIHVESLFNQALIWSSQIQKTIEKNGDTPRLPDSFFEELYSILMLDENKREKALHYFSNKGMGKWIQKEVYLHLLKKSQKYGLNEQFLNEIHPFMREGLKKQVERLENKKENLIKSRTDSISELLIDLDKEIQLQIIETLKNRADKAN
ncbi:MAG: hypothetical protein RR554_11615 [Vagococcus sp.]|uniref:hypothetical protein n=1 Tax=Vagococcus sp. TaxID=1933889 RepID=UPI002FC9912E